MIRHVVQATLILVAAGLAPVALGAQAVTGVVANVNNAERITGAEVLLFTTDSVLDAAAFSGENGEFFIEASQAGTYSLEIRHLGFKGRSATLVLQTGKVIEVRVNLAPEATELEGITVYGQTAETSEQREFLSRRHLPWNYSFDMAQIEQMHAANVYDVVRFGMPGGEARCYTVYLDGRPNVTGTGFNREFDSIPIGWVYGIEVYRTYLDIPQKYRDPFADPQMRCGGLLIWSTVAPGAGLPAVWAFGFGVSPALERGVLDISWRRGLPNRYVTSVRLRVGDYDPYELLGRDRATEMGYESDTRPGHVSGYIGRQGPAVLLPWKRHLFTRIAGGATFYGGQRGETTVDADTLVALRADIAPYFGLGGEVALGFRLPSGKVRPWLEARTGTEYLTRTGFRWLNPVFTVGIEIGRMAVAPGS